MTPEPGVFWRITPDSLTLTVKVQPRSRRPGIQGQAISARGPCLRIGVSEPAEDGRANRALCGVVAEALLVPGAAVSVITGAASRDKTIHVVGSPEALAARLQQL